MYGFLFGMWVLILIGGGIVVTVLGPLSISGHGDLDTFLSSLLKGGISIVLAIIWIVVLSKMKRLVFDRMFNQSRL